MVSGFTVGKDASLVPGMKETEGQLYSNDKLVIDTEDRKNALEEMIYDQRSKLDDRYKLFVTSEEKEKYLAALNAQEEWLYSDEGEDAKSRRTSNASMRCRRSVTHPVPREKEFQERPRPPLVLREAINKYMEMAQGGDEQYSHISDDDKQKVIESAPPSPSGSTTDCTSSRTAQERRSQDCQRRHAQEEGRGDLFCHPIMSKVKPRVDTTQAPNPAKERRRRSSRPRRLMPRLTKRRSWRDGCRLNLLGEIKSSDV